jgi:antirestriction protein ArdC
VDENTGQEREVSPMIRVPKLHTVFNIAQTEGITFAIDETLKRSHTEKIEACEQIIAGMPQQPPIHHSGDSACYYPLRDEVYMPEQSLFLADESYYSTLFHELAHSTGHQSRLNREEVMKTDRFGGVVYSQEELTAELTAAYLCGVSGIRQKTIDNSAAYIKGWLSKLKNDNKFFLKAARQARAAADYILNQPQDDYTTMPADTNTVAAL